MGLVVDRLDAADAGADDDGRARPADVLVAEARLRHRLVGGDDGVLGEGVAKGQDLGSR